MNFFTIFGTLRACIQKPFRLFTDRDTERSRDVNRKDRWVHIKRWEGLQGTIRRRKGPQGAVPCQISLESALFSDMPPLQYFVLLIVMGKRDNILPSIFTLNEKVVISMVHLLFMKSTSEPPLIYGPPLWLPCIFGWYTYSFLVMLAFILQNDNMSFIIITQYLIH